MSCEYGKDKLSAWALGLLDAAERLRLEQHLQTCASCRAEAARLRQTGKLLDQAFQETLPAGLREKTLARIRRHPQSSRNWLVWGVPALAGAAAVALLAVLQPQWLGQGVKGLAIQPAANQPQAAGQVLAEDAVMEKKSEAKESVRAAEMAVQPPASSAGAPASKPLARLARSASQPGGSLPADAILPQAVSEELDIQLANPINDRSLYEDLGVATEVAKLLL